MLIQPPDSQRIEGGGERTRESSHTTNSLSGKELFPVFLFSFSDQLYTPRAESFGNPNALSGRGMHARGKVVRKSVGFLRSEGAGAARRAHGERVQQQSERRDAGSRAGGDEKRALMPRASPALRRRLRAIATRKVTSDAAMGLWARAQAHRRLTRGLFGGGAMALAPQKINPSTREGPPDNLNTRNKLSFQQVWRSQQPPFARCSGPEAQRPML